MLTIQELQDFVQNLQRSFSRSAPRIGATSGTAASDKSLPHGLLMTREKAREIAHQGAFHPQLGPPPRANGDQGVATSVLHHCRTRMVRSRLATRERLDAATPRVVSQEVDA
jgi:hypothetical protein